MKTGKSVFLAVAVMLFCAVSVYGQDTREFEERKAALEKEIEMLDRQLAETRPAAEANFPDCRW